MISKESSDGNRPIKAIIICGPTGSGKSVLAMELAQHFNGQIVSADSRQIYRDLDIGTAKPSREDRALIPHYLIDVADVGDDFTAKKYSELASEAMIKIVSENAVPFIVGGSGLYLSALTEGLFEGPERDPDIRTKLESTARERGSQYLFDELAKIDLQSAQIIGPGDRIRIIRALEVYYLTGQKLSELKKTGEYHRLNADYLWLGITYSRQVLYKRIDSRVDKMLEDGLLEEINSLLSNGFGNSLLSKKIVGYYEIASALQNNTPIESAISQIKQHSRNYAKRQLTWFKNKAPVIWVTANSERCYDIFERQVANHLTNIA
jgi:tRNA dimethylallyltransferase